MPLCTALHPMDEGVWHSRVEPATFFYLGQNQIPKDTLSNSG